MRDQWIRRKGQHFVEHKQGEQIAGERDAHGARKRDRKAHVEARLIVLVVAPHITDRIDRRQNPKARRDRGEDHAKWFNDKHQRKIGNSLKRFGRRSVTGQDGRDQGNNGEE